MHEAAVIGLCAIVGYFAWCDAAELFLSWYSGTDPPLSVTAKFSAWFRIVFGLAASAVAIATL